MKYTVNKTLGGWKLKAADTEIAKISRCADKWKTENAQGIRLFDITVKDRQALVSGAIGESVITLLAEEAKIAPVSEKISNATYQNIAGLWMISRTKDSDFMVTRGETKLLLKLSFKGEMEFESFEAQDDVLLLVTVVLLMFAGSDVDII